MRVFVTLASLTCGTASALANKTAAAPMNDSKCMLQELVYRDRKDVKLNSGFLILCLTCRQQETGDTSPDFIGQDEVQKRVLHKANDRFTGDVNHPRAIPPGHRSGESLFYTIMQASLYAPELPQPNASKCGVTHVPIRIVGGREGGDLRRMWWQTPHRSANHRRQLEA